MNSLPRYRGRPLLPERGQSIPETLLHHIWKQHDTFLSSDLLLRDGSRLSILHPGEHNTDRGGPDFLNARIAIGDVALSGDIELHLNEKGWHEHHHDSDNRYGRVILHVVLSSEDDPTVGPHVPTLSLREHIVFEREDLWKKLFEHLYDRTPELPCFPHNMQLSMPFKRKVIERFGDARMDELVGRLVPESSDYTEDALLQSVYERIMDALGYSENRKPFVELARLLPLPLLQAVRKRAVPGKEAITFEALYFGAAGLLPQPSQDFDLEANDRITELRAVWESLQVVVKLFETLAESDWAFFRIRPLNSPHRRVALAAVLAAQIFSKDRWSFDDPCFLNADISCGSVGEFWEQRTSFGSLLDQPNSLMGDERREAIILNVLLPARMARLKSAERIHGLVADRARMEDQLRLEWGGRKTRTSARYSKTIQQELLEGERVNTVRSEQGALMLTRNFCERSRCSECPIGQKLIKQGWRPEQQTSNAA